MERLARNPERAAHFRSLFEDESSFRSWYESAVPRVYAYLFDRCGGVKAVAEELTQDAFVEAVRHRNRFDGRSDPVTWVIAIARHKLADHYRKLHRDEKRHLKLVSGQAAEDRGEDPWAAAEDRETVLRALRSLPALQRAALVLHYLDQLPVSEIARELDKSEAAVESLLSRGRHGFRRALRTAHQEVRDA